MAVLGPGAQCCGDLANCELDCADKPAPKPAPAPPAALVDEDDE